MPWVSPQPLLPLAIRDVGSMPSLGTIWLIACFSMVGRSKYCFMALIVYSGQACGFVAIQFPRKLQVVSLLSSFLCQKSCLKDFFQDRCINFHLFLYSMPLSPNLMAVTGKPYETKLRWKESLETVLCTSAGVLCLTETSSWITFSVLFPAVGAQGPTSGLPRFLCMCACKPGRSCLRLPLTVSC